MTDQRVFDPKTATVQVETAVWYLVQMYVEAGQSGPLAISDTAKNLQMLGCDEDYIKSALEYARVEGEKGWRKKHGL